MTRPENQPPLLANLLQRRLGPAMIVVVVIATLSTFGVFAAPGMAAEDTSAKTGVPAADELRAGLRSLQEVFGADAAAARSPEAKCRIAAEMLTAANKEPSVVNRYTLLEMARRLAEDAGDVDVCNTLVDRITNEFAVDGEKLRGQTLIEAARNATGDNASRAVEVLTAFASEKAKADSAESVEPFVKAALTAARKSGRKSDLERAQRALSDLRSFTKTQSRVAMLRERVKQNPDDQKSLTELAVQLSETDDDCLESLRILASGSDAGVTRLARADMAVGLNPQASLAVADAWWDFSESAKGDLAVLALKRAVHHYHGAISDLEGLEKTRVEKRIAAAARKPGNTRSGKREKNLVFHLDAASPSALLGDDGRPLPEFPRSPLPVSGWLDPENLLAAAKQAAPSSRPVAVIHPASGLRAVRFEANQTLVSSQPLPNAGTLLLVVDPARPLAPGCFVGAVNGTSGLDVWTRANAEGMFRVLDANGKPFHISTAPGVMAGAGAHVVTIQWLEPMVLRIDGKVVSDQKNVPAMDRGLSKGIVLGAHSDTLANPYSGLLCECLLFDTQLPPDDVLKIERTLSAKWKAGLGQ